MTTSVFQNAEDNGFASHINSEAGYNVLGKDLRASYIVQ